MKFASIHFYCSTFLVSVEKQFYLHHIRICENPVPDSTGKLLLQIHGASIFMNVVADFKKKFTVNILDWNSAVDNEFSGSFNTKSICFYYNDELLLVSLFYQQ